MSTGVWIVVGGFGCAVLVTVGRTAAGVRRRRSSLRHVMRERAGWSEARFLGELERDGIESRVAQPLYREIGDIVRLHDGMPGFPVFADDDLRELYRFILALHAGYPDDPDLWGLTHDVALAAGRKFSYDSAVEVELGAVRTVRDLARWVQALPQSDADASIHTSTTPDA